MRQTPNDTQQINPKRLRTSGFLLTFAVMLGAGLFSALGWTATGSATASTSPTALSEGQIEASQTTVRANQTSLASTTVLTGSEWLPPNPAYRIVIDQDGMHQLTYSALSSAGLPVDTLDPKTFRMFYMGKEIPIQIEGENDGSFDSGDVIHFYGLTLDTAFHQGILPTNKYTADSVYWLSYGGANGQRMATQSGSATGGETSVTTALASSWQEGNLTYFSNRPFIQILDLPERYEPGADRWHWIWLRRTSNSARNFPPISIPNPVTNASDGQLVVNILGNDSKVRLADPDVNHHMKLYVNGTIVYDNPNAGINFELFTITATVPANIIQQGSNQVRIELAGTSNEVYVNWYELSYQSQLTALNNQLVFNGESGSGPWRYTVDGFTTSEISVFDVTDPNNPFQIIDTEISGTQVSFTASGADRRYAVDSAIGYHSPSSIELATVNRSAYTPDDLLNTANEADWIAITHGDFFSESLRLADHRTSLYRVALIDVQQIYDQFNGGMRSSESIREFLRYAYHNWSGDRPRYVLLVGDGNNDMRQYRSQQATYIPPFLAVADPFLGETAADNRYVTLVGNDLLPDMAIGRFPVDTVDEAKLIVDKTISYETTPYKDDWNQNVLLISDDLDKGGGDFYHFSDVLADGYERDIVLPENKFLPEPYTSTKVYLGVTCDPDNPGKDDTAVNCRQDVVDVINQGALFTSYVGHAQSDRWAVESLMDSTLIGQFTNTDRLSIFLAMACFEGVFHDPNVTPLAEQYLLRTEGGAVASWSPTGYGVATGHDLLEQGLFLAVFQDGVTTMGDATNAGKQYLHDNTPPGALEDLLDTFLLFGDPALQIKVAVGPTAVDMVDFSLSAEEETMLTWQTANELDIAGFNVLAGPAAQGPFAPINPEPILAQWTGMAQGDSYQYSVPAQYLASVAENQWYVLEILGTDGSRRTYGLAGSQQQINRMLFLPGVQK